MNTDLNSPPTLALSTHLYRALLRAYPAEFRREYAGPMLQVFRDSARRALMREGETGLVRLWLRTLLDFFQSVIEQYSQRGVDMSKEKFVKLSGWALMLGGLAVMLGFLAGTRPQYNQFNAASLPVDRYANFAEFPLIVMGLLLLSAGFIGLFLRYGLGAGSFGRFSLGFGAVCGLLSAVGAIGLGISDSESWWSLFFFGMICQYLGLTLFGVANLRRRALPRWNGLPLMAGFWIPLFALVSIIYEQVRGGWVELPDAVFMSLWLLTLIGLAGLGFLLQSDQPAAGAPAAAA